MKKLFRYLNIATLFIALSAVFASCSDKDDVGDGNIGLNIKVFAPTIVVPGTPMTINGSGFNDVTEIVFPGDIKVTDFNIVSNEMIRVKAPAGLSQEGTIMVANSAGETAVSRLPLTIGHTEITGYYPLNFENGEYNIIKGNELLTIYGKDMQFVTGAEFIDEDNNPIYIPASEFMRVAPGRVVIQVPAKVMTALLPVKIYIGNQIVETPEFQFETAKNAGHWVTTKRYIWKNETGEAVPSWGGKFRFGLDGHDGNNECIATFDNATWETIKEDLVYFEYTPGAAPNVRITTGWWSDAYGGGEHNCHEDAKPGDKDNMVIELNISGDKHIYDLIDAQHLLFTGDGYTPVGLFVYDQEWVEGEEGHFETVRTSFWENGKQSTIPVPSWSGEGRFACVTNSTGEETYAFSEEEWQVLKSEPFRIKIESLGAPNVRVTTGWWSTTYGGNEYNCFNIAEPVPGEAGKYFIELNLANYPDLLDAVDAQHLLFTGSDYKLLEIYTEKEEWVGGPAGGGETIIWEGDGSAGAVDWNGVYRFCNVEHMTGEEIFAIPMDQWNEIKNGSFWLHAKGSDWVQMRITTGWWSTTWTGADITTGDDRIISNDDGTYDIEINFAGDPILDVLDDQHLLFTGGGYTPLKLYIKK